MIPTEQELEEFRQWKLSRHSPLDEAFFALERTLANPMSRGFDAVMPVMAFRVLANALIELKKVVLK